MLSDDEYYRDAIYYSGAMGAGRPNPTTLVGHEWAQHYFPKQFNRPFAEYQKLFWEWAWNIEPDQYYRPRIDCQPRGVGKSTNAEAWIVSLVARKKRKMIGYVSFEEDKAGKHFDSIKALLETPALLRDYPHCRPKIQKLRNSAAQWSRDALITDSNAMIVPLSLQGSSRGWKSPDSVRFDVLILDDIDKMGMSIELIKKLLELLKSEILAAGDDNTVVLMPQNLIHRDSICSQVLDHRADILSDRIFCGPYPLLNRYEAEKVDIEGDTNNAKKWIITSGESFDPAISVEYAEKLLNKFGKATFERECQQNTRKVADDKDFREWDEVYHVITYSEFRNFFAERKINVWSEARRHPIIPHNWNVGLGFDWGSTLKHPAAIATLARPPQTAPLNDCFFSFTEVIMPKFPVITGEDVPAVSPGRVVKALQEAMAEWNVSDAQITQRLMSHEASATMNTMRIDLAPELKTFFQKWVAKRGSGVPQLQNLLEIDHSEMHPFREGVMGKPRIYFVVPDEQGELLIDDYGKHIVAQPYDYKGLVRARYEIPLYSHENGGQNKSEDDWTDGMLGLANVFGVISKPMTRKEERERALPVHLQNLEEIRLGQTIEIQERINLQRAIEFQKLDQKEAQVRSKISKYRPTVPSMGAIRRR